MVKTTLPKTRSDLALISFVLWAARHEAKTHGAHVRDMSHDQVHLVTGQDFSLLADHHTEYAWTDPVTHKVYLVAREWTGAERIGEALAQVLLAVRLPAQKAAPTFLTYIDQIFAYAHARQMMQNHERMIRDLFGVHGQSQGSSLSELVLSAVSASHDRPYDEVYAESTRQFFTGWTISENQLRRTYGPHEVYFLNYCVQENLRDRHTVVERYLAQEMNRQYIAEMVLPPAAYRRYVTLSHTS